MHAMKRRSRVVSFRLSDDEYQRIMKTCAELGVRSLSDYARRAALQTLGSLENAASHSDADFRSLESRVEMLERAVEQLALERNPLEITGSGALEESEEQCV
jgi:hypothetical protein